MKNIRNFSIIAHIDHGKSTLADRMLEITGTIEKRKMHDQVLDSMELERERGITIKMQPVRMFYEIKHSNCPRLAEGQYILNLIDTPGHIDFSYEVSRALKAVEGSILLVDATQGVQAQTLTTLNMAKELGLTIIPVLSKIDSPLARVDEVKEEIVKLLGCDEKDIVETSGKTGEGVSRLLDLIIEKVPPPKIIDKTEKFRSLVFDFKYSTHKGVIVFVRVMNGSVRKNAVLNFKVGGKKFTSLEVGIFSPDEKPKDELKEGEIGYIVTGIKEPGIASVGDTVSSVDDTLPPLSGYLSPKPVVWASIYPESQDDFITLKQSLLKLKLTDSSFTFEEESFGSVAGGLGRGFRCGFLGMLHLEIITERLKREFDLSLVVTMPTITYEVTYKNHSKNSNQVAKKEIIYSPINFPDDGVVSEIREPWVQATLITPSSYLGNLVQMLYEHEAIMGKSENIGEEKVEIFIEMPLRELMRNFFDELKSVTSGFGSISYELKDMRPANVVRMDILVADEVVPAFSRVVSRRIVEEEAEKSVEKLSAIIPRQMFAMKVQAKALGRIISSKSISAFRKDVTQHMYGGDITRKMKLREKQKKGKKKMRERGKINISHDVFLKMMR